MCYFCSVLSHPKMISWTFKNQKLAKHQKCSTFGIERNEKSIFVFFLASNRIRHLFTHENRKSHPHPQDSQNTTFFFSFSPVWLNDLKYIWIFCLMRSAVKPSENRKKRRTIEMKRAREKESQTDKNSWIRSTKSVWIAKPSNADKGEQKSNMSKWRRVQLSYLMFLSFSRCYFVDCFVFGVIFKNILLKLICTVSLAASLPETKNSQLVDLCCCCCCCFCCNWNCESLQWRC